MIARIIAWAILVTVMVATGLGLGLVFRNQYLGR